jgi:predicted DNA-binding transcriptional regulator YafY
VEEMSDPKKYVVIDYTNWRGERSQRLITPLSLSYENNEWHPESQWLLEALDIERDEVRTFAMSQIHSWAPPP